MLNFEQLALYGIFGFTVYEHKSGAPVKVFSVLKKNQITNSGRLLVLNLLANPATLSVDNQIGRLYVGTNATPPTMLDTVVTMHDVEQLDLVYGVDITLDSPGFLLSVMKELAPAEAVGSTLTEAGIVTMDDSTLYARQIHSPIIKTGTMTVTYTWQLGVSIQA